MNKIGIIGVGRLGICLALNLERVGYEVHAVDSSAKRVEEINARQIEVEEPFVQEYLSEATHISASMEVSKLATVDFIFICVPTPSLPDGGYDHSYIESCIAQLHAIVPEHERVEVVINSTTMPGYCEDLHQRLKDTPYEISYNPEFIAQGSIVRDQQYPDQVLIGETDAHAGDKIEAVYKRLCKNEPRINRMSRTSAEITKLSVNCFLTTKIAFANAIGDLTIALEGEHEKVLSAIGSDSRIGNAYLSYGYGFGGPCLPRDNRALAKAGKDKSLNLFIAEATDKANQSHLEFQLMELKNQARTAYTFDSITYKPGTDIIEEAQQLALAVKLAKSGAAVTIKGPKKVMQAVQQLHGELFQYEVESHE